VPRPGKGRGRAGARATAEVAVGPPATLDAGATTDPGTTSDPGADEEPAGGAGRTPATERRRAADALVARWSDLTRDLLLCRIGLAGDVRDLALLDDLAAAAAGLEPAALTGFLDRLGRAAVHLRGNVSPELVLDDLAVAWPRPAVDPSARRRAS
jgi:hypothetical protein